MSGGWVSPAAIPAGSRGVPTCLHSHLPFAPCSYDPPLRWYPHLMRTGVWWVGKPCRNTSRLKGRPHMFAFCSYDPPLRWYPHPMQTGVWWGGKPCRYTSRLKGRPHMSSLLHGGFPAAHGLCLPLPGQATGIYPVEKGGALVVLCPLPPQCLPWPQELWEGSARRPGPKKKVLARYASGVEGNPCLLHHARMTHSHPGPARVPGWGGGRVPVLRHSRQPRDKPTCCTPAAWGFPCCIWAAPPSPRASHWHRPCGGRGCSLPLLR